MLGFLFYITNFLKYEPSFSRLVFEIQECLSRNAAIGNVKVLICAIILVAL
jgi:hypothetical protein